MLLNNPDNSTSMPCSQSPVDLIRKQLLLPALYWSNFCTTTVEISEHVSEFCAGDALVWLSIFTAVSDRYPFTYKCFITIVCHCTYVNNLLKHSVRTLCSLLTGITFAKLLTAFPASLKLTLTTNQLDHYAP